MNIKDLYESGINIQQYFRERNQTNKNDINAILLSYDYQAGEYTANYNDSDCMEEVECHGEKVAMTNRAWTELAGKLIAREIETYDPDSVLEVGTGEATILAEVIACMKGEKEIEYTGIDISLSRLLYAKKFVKERKLEVDLAVADLFQLPFADGQFDVVFLRNCLESNTGREKEAITELLRIANKCVILIEPSYRLGNEETRKRIKELGYVDHIDDALEGLHVVKNEKFAASLWNNNTAIIVIEKEETVSRCETKWSCPRCGNGLAHLGEALYCDECFNIYPLIGGGIPLLTSENAVLCSKWKKCLEE
ncbi:class I SAM-dependent methyltransferase [Lachnospiraceae bacterium JLR.KK008]